ncbi:hypothetical protein DPMN_081137 [Dreissena polymorpha]|uniref:Uncharacterized protein n=1 Tax=Dreissena polymorpha TaxID=45954 RepID=A0A9D4BG06_DREPO|nr:hypothetical protein DPMN_081137 [Dreissena polymorpha]
MLLFNYGVDVQRNSSNKLITDAGDSMQQAVSRREHTAFFCIFIEAFGRKMGLHAYSVALNQFVQSEATLIAFMEHPVSRKYIPTIFPVLTEISMNRKVSLEISLCETHKARVYHNLFY